MPKLEMSNNGYEALIPTLSKDVDIARFSENDMLITHNILEHRLKINNSTALILGYIDGVNSISDIADKYSREQNDFVDGETIYKLLSHLSSYGVVEGLNSDIQIKKVKSRYLKLRMILIRSKYLDYFTGYFEFLFKPKLFYPIFISSYLILIPLAIVFFRSSFENLYNFTITDLIIAFFVIGIALFFHELGHVSACRALGVKHGDIGFGFYLFTPVMFADVTDVWRLPSKKRIIVNLAGMYFGNIVSLLFIIIYYFSSLELLLYVSLFSFVESLFNMNPFIKYDGYWVLSDIINVPNLHNVAYQKLKKGFKLYRKYNIKDWCLVLYGLASLSFIVLFLGIVLLFDPESILMFPVNIFNYATDLINGNLIFNIEQLTQFIVPLIFYYLTLKFILSVFMHKWRQVKSKKKTAI